MAVKSVVHLNCGTMRPVGGRLLNRSPARVVCHCLVVETGAGLVLVDTGVGMADMKDPKRLGPMHYLLNLRQDENETALRQIQQLGYGSTDVKHILLSHLDLDHAGGIADFPEANIHVWQPEYQAAMEPTTPRERHRYRRVHFEHGPRWVIHEKVCEESWYGLPCIKVLEGDVPEILLVPLAGHTRGHCGVAVETEEGWLLHAGDTYYHEQQMKEPPGCTPGFRLFQLLAHADPRKAAQQADRLRNLPGTSPSGVRVFCTHDPLELEELSGTSVS